MRDAVVSGDRYFRAKRSIKAVLERLNGLDLSLKEKNNVIEYYRPTANIEGELYEFPLTVLIGDENGDIEILSYDLKAKRFNSIFKDENYPLDQFDFYIKVFRGRPGYLLFILAENKKEVDSTPFIVTIREYEPKISFKKADLYIKTEEVEFSYIDREVSGIYTAILVDSTKKKYELSYKSYLITKIEAAANYYLKHDKNIINLFLDKYDESPFLLELKEGMFKTCIAGIALFEEFTSDFLYYIKYPEKRKKAYTEAEIAKIMKTYDSSIAKTFGYLNAGLADLLATGNVNRVTEKIENLAKHDSQFEYARYRRAAAEKFLVYSWRKLGR